MLTHIRALHSFPAWTTFPSLPCNSVWPHDPVVVIARGLKRMSLLSLPSKPQTLLNTLLPLWMARIKMTSRATLRPMCSRFSLSPRRTEWEFLPTWNWYMTKNSTPSIFAGMCNILCVTVALVTLIHLPWKRDLFRYVTFPLHDFNCYI